MAFIIDKCAFMKNSMHVARMISYLERQSDLFSDSGELNFEQAYQSYVDASPPRVWHHIISLSDEDAQRQNVDREYMKQLVCVEQSRIAEAYNTVPSNMRIVASWHEKDHHPHLHLLFYSTDRREGGVWAHTDQEAKARLNDASEKVKSLFANRIFADDLAPLREIKNMRRAELNQQIKQSIRGIAQHDPSDEVVKALEHLSHSLSGLKGKLHYEYLPPHIKSEVDDLLRTVIDTEPTCRSLQEQYAQSCRDLILTYARKSEVVSRKMGEWEERFWHPHKADDKTRHNMIIKAASELTPYLTQEDVSPPNIEDAAAQTPDAETAYNQCQHKIVRSARATLFNKNASDSDRTHSLNTLQSAADNGDKYAAYQLGKAYQTGTFVEKDLIYAHQYLQAAMTEKSDWVAYSIGKLFKDEDFDDYDRAKAIQYFELADKMGSETASYQLGKAYLEGDSLQQDYWKAIKMFEKTDGFLKSAAIYSLGKIYADAKFEGHSKDKAIQYLEQAQKMGNEAAFYQLGKVYLSGEPSQQDYQKAIQMFEQAEGVLEPWAVYALGKIYLDENFNEHSRDKAIQCFEHAQELENETAVYQLGKIYSSGEASQEDYLKAIQLLEQTKGVLKPWAEYKIGTIYQDERFSQKDLRLAVYHFQKAAGLGNEFAQYKLAKAYLQGDGVEPSTGKAIQLFEKLMQTKSEIAKAAQLNIWSEYYLGKIYLYGLGIQSNPGKGKELLQHAAENNCEPAQKLLERYNLYRAKSAMQTVKSLIMRIANSLQADTTQAKNYRPTTKTRYEHLRQAEKHQDQRTEEMYY